MKLNFSENMNTLKHISVEAANAPPIDNHHSFPCANFKSLRVTLVHVAHVINYIYVHARVTLL